MKQLWAELKKFMKQSFVVTKCPYCGQENRQKEEEFNQLGKTTCCKCGGTYPNVLNSLGKITISRIRFPEWLKKFNEDCKNKRSKIEFMDIVLEKEAVGDEILEEELLAKDAPKYI